MTFIAALIAFILLGIVTVAAGLAAVAMRNLVHCGLSLALAFCGVGGLYILLGAEFLGFIQMLVYVGAVAVLIMFVILLTRPGEVSEGSDRQRVRSALPGLVVSAAVFAVLAGAIGNSRLLQVDGLSDPDAPIAAIGQMLVTSHLLPLQIIGVVLTVALIGGVLCAIQENGET